MNANLIDNRFSRPTPIKAPAGGLNHPGSQPASQAAQSRAKQTGPKQLAQKSPAKNKNIPETFQKHSRA